MDREESYSLKVIGYMRSPFLFKNGTPRQPTICGQITGEITIEKSIFNNPEHSLEGLEEFSHVWIFFIFHKNNNVHFKAKVKPPRLNGKKTGVFSTRSPYRPNNVGLTLAKIESVKGATLTVSGIDILDGTPIIDLKPFIPHYDNPAVETVEIDQQQLEHNEVTEISSTSEPKNQSENEGTVKQTDLNTCEKDIEAFKDEKSNCVDVHLNSENDFELECFDTHTDNKQVSDQRSNAIGSPSFSCNKQTDLSQSLNQNWEVNLPEGIKKKEQFQHMDYDQSGIKCSTADWINKAPVSRLKVRFTPSAEEQLKLFSSGDSNVDFRFQFLESHCQASKAISDILHEDPRSTYRRNHCADSLYYFTLDVLHITCWFDEDLVEIVRIKPVKSVEKLKEKLDI